MKTKRHILFGALALSGAIALGAGPASAGLTTVRSPINGEHSHEQILENVYGGDFVLTSSGFTNGTITVTRADDPDPSSDAFSLASTASDDATIGDSFSARAVAKFSGYTQSFGVEGGGGFANLFDVSGFGYNVTGGISGTSLSGPWNFARSGETGTHASVVGLNEDLRDHLISYEISGLDTTQNTWLLFWEDLTLTAGLSKERSTADFNDLVVEVRSGEINGPVAVPLPPALIPGLAMLAGLGGLKKRLARRTVA
jgi:hypothetical protein